MELGFKSHLSTIFRHWGKLVLVITGALLVTGAVAFMSSRVYVSEARILILNSSPAERASRTTFVDPGAAVSSPQEQVLTQVEIFRSPALAEKLALQIGPQRILDEMTWRWDWLRDLPSALKDRILTGLYKWESTAGVLESIGISKPGPEETGIPLGPAREKIMDALHAEAIVKTDMFGVAYAAPSPEFAAEVLNEIIDIYVDHVVDLRRTSDTAEVAQQEADRLERVLGEAEEELREFAREADILSINRQQELLLDRRSRIQDELASAQRSSLETEQKIASIESQVATLPRNESISVTTRPNPVVDRLRERLAQLQTDNQRYVSGSAAADRTRREIDLISQQLEQEAAAVRGAQTVGTSSLYQSLQNTKTLETAEREALKVRIDFLGRELEMTEAELRRLEGHEPRYRLLQRAVDAKEEAYRYALQKREETVVQTQISRTSLAEVVPVERGAVPDVPSYPRRARLLALGVIAGLMAGVGLSYLLEFMRRSMSTVLETEAALGLPVLAATERYGLLSKRLERTRMEMRRLAVWILPQRQADKAFWLMFSSAHPRSGQSGLAKEVARALQQQGAHVLTIQLNQSERAVKIGEIAPSGNSAVFARNDLVVVEAPAWEVGQQLRKLMMTIKTSEQGAHDVVLFDPPCISRFPEQGILAELVDVVLPVVEADRTKLAEIREQFEDLRHFNAKIPGVALTKRSHAGSSWAFSWMAVSRRNSMVRNA